VNVDIGDYGQEVNSDLRTLPFDDNSAFQADAIHVIEHFPAWEAEPLITEWFRVMMPGGVLRVEFPDFTKVLKIIQNAKDLTDERLLEFLYGALYGDYKEKNLFMTHRWCFLPADVSMLMKQVGFEYVITSFPTYHYMERDAAVVGVKA